MLPGGRLTLEDSYAYAKFARIALASNDIDMRARPHSAEEADFLAALVAGQEAGTSYTGLERARAVLLAGFEPEDESPMVFLRLRKAARTQGLAVYSIAPFASRGLARLSGVLLPTLPGTEAQAIDALAADRTGPAAASGPDGARPGSRGGAWAEAAGALRGGGAIILAGERLAEVPGALSALARLAAATGARLAWIPRRAGERGAIETGAVPNLLPGGRPVSDPDARAEVARAWGVATLPGEPGRDTSGILTAAAAGEIGALVVAGVDPGDLPAPAAALAALAAARFVVSLELRVSAVTDRADVVLPVAAAAEKAGTFVNWEGRPGTFRPALSLPGLRSDLEVLGRIADAMDVHLGLPDAAAARREIAGLGSWPGSRPAAPAVPSRPPARPGAGAGRAGHLAPAPGHRADAGRRAVPGRHRTAAGGPDVSGHRGGGGNRRRAYGHREHGARIGDRSGADRGHARPRGVAACPLRRMPGAACARRRARHRGDAEERGMSTLPVVLVRGAAWVVVEDGRLLEWSCGGWARLVTGQCCCRASGVVE